LIPVLILPNISRTIQWFGWQYFDLSITGGMYDGYAYPAYPIEFQYNNKFPLCVIGTCNGMGDTPESENKGMSFEQTAIWVTHVEWHSNEIGPVTVLLMGI
jgi:hypothetical protein